MICSCTVYYELCIGEKMICKLEIDINYVNVGTFFVRFIDVKARSFSLFQEMDSMLSDHVMALHAGKTR